MYSNFSNGCEASGDFVRVPFAVGCIELNSNTSVDIECSSNTISGNMYNNANCVGDPSSSNTIISSGCDDDEKSYIQLTCGAPEKKFISYIIFAVLMVYLFNH